MSYIKSILYDEYERLKALSAKYLAEAASLPKGSISVKKRRQREYLYLAYREKNRVISKYIGPLDSAKSQEIIKKIGLRKQYEKKLKKVGKDIAEIERFVHGRKI